jgi:polyisoprenoid-binding protein YceI
MENKTKWNIDLRHSEIEFKVRHLMISNLKGKFTRFDASIYTSGKDFTTAEIDLWIDADSLTTGDSKRDNHLKGVDFFDVKNHHQISFTSQNIGQSDRLGHHELWGNLSMKGITKHIQLDVEFGGITKDITGQEKSGFVVSGKINRNDWNLDWNKEIEFGGLMIGEEINILCEVELINVGIQELIMVLDSKSSQDGIGY